VEKKEALQEVLHCKGGTRGSSFSIAAIGGKNERKGDKEGQRLQRRGRIERKKKEQFLL